MTGTGLTGELLRAVWADKRLGWGVTLLAAVGYALLAGWWTPRGPMSALQALAAMGLGLLVGLFAGLALRTRWAMPVTPAALAAAFELVPLAVFVIRQASTGPVADSDGQRVPGSVAELTRVENGRHDLAMMIRGLSVENPVLLVLAGGPGGSELGAKRRHSEALENDFTVVTVDQRCTGKSYDQLDPTSTLTLDQAVADTLTVTSYLRKRFGQDKICLAGQPWGTVPGVLAVQRQPELFSAFVGVGRIVSPKEAVRIFYRDTLAWTRESGNARRADTLTVNGPPPYTSKLDYEAALSYERKDYPYSHAGNSQGSGQMGENILVGEYTLREQLHILAGFMDTFSVLYPQIQNIDFRTRATSLQVPVYRAQGRHEATGRQLLAQEWSDQLCTPSKQLTYFEISGHRPYGSNPTSSRT